MKEKGRGIVTTKVFEKDEYICEYGGHLITSKKGGRLRMNMNMEEHLFYFEHKGQKLWYNYDTFYHRVTGFMLYMFCFIVWMLLKNQGRKFKTVW